MARYPDKEEVIDILFAAARSQALDNLKSNDYHPEDIGIALSTAIEAGAVTLAEAWKKWGGSGAAETWVQDGKEFRFVPDERGYATPKPPPRPEPLPNPVAPHP